MILPDWADTTEPITTNLLADWCKQNHVTVQDGCVFIDRPTLDGIYNHARRTIYLSRHLPQRYLLPTLAHETVHAFYEHDGHQPDRVEQRIDEALAVRLVDSSDYARWEREYGWHTGGIASAMGQPRWLIEAYRRVLAKQAIA